MKWKLGIGPFFHKSGATIPVITNEGVFAFNRAATDNKGTIEIRDKTGAFDVRSLSDYTKEQSPFPCSIIQSGNSAFIAVGEPDAIKKTLEAGKKVNVNQADLNNLNFLASRSNWQQNTL
jgi:hypothetical protein